MCAMGAQIAVLAGRGRFRSNWKSRCCQGVLRKFSCSSGQKDLTCWRVGARSSEIGVTIATLAVWEHGNGLELRLSLGLPMGDAAGVAANDCFYMCSMPISRIFSR